MSSQPHDGAQSQLEDHEGTEASTASDADPRVQNAPTVPVSGEPNGSSQREGTSPPGTPAASPRQPAIAVPGQPDGETDTRR